ncbi:MAG: thiopurine S-methyltransferase, partial [SAR324 cluster bacterium]|nr:thiopurine S-methyltransferase [SAR324 cluster bacterium]
MDQKYDFDGWSSRWDEDRIGFHVAKPNPFLLQYWHHLHEIKPKRCLVPLCGKSLDLVWLSEKVETVIGVELVEKAVLDFFREQQIIPEIQKNSPFNAYSHQGLKI